MTTSGLGRILLCALAGLLPAVASAQAYPSKPVRLVVPYPPGGVVDVTTRAIALPLTEGLGQQIVVENRPGGGGNIATDFVARAAPDGYTLLIFADTNTIAPSLYPKLNHDPVKDFAPITMLAAGSHILVAHPSVPAGNLKELIALAKQKPGALAYASPGNGTAQHLGTEMLKTMAGINLTHVPYKGGGQAISDVVGGQVPLGMLGLAPALPHIKSGRLKAIAVTGRKRTPVLPEVPTMIESGLPGFSTTLWLGAVAPAGTPAPVIQKLHAEFVKAAHNPAVIERLAAVGLEPATNATPQEFAALIREEIARWTPIVKASGAKPD
jgi:tripartite-type tricarboxylate transporter receptor subunit TctC